MPNEELNKAHELQQHLYLNIKINRKGLQKRSVKTSFNFVRIQLKSKLKMCNKKIFRYQLNEYNIIQQLTLIQKEKLYYKKIIQTLSK